MRFVMLALLLLGSTVEARAAGDVCYSLGGLDPTNTLVLSRVIASGRTNFVQSAEAGNGCPAAKAACAGRAFLIQGDQVVTSYTVGTFVCAEYTSPKGATTAGFLPVAALAPVPVPSAQPKLVDWVGNWTTGLEQTVAIKRGGRSGELSLSGEATWGALDPERVKRGAVHIGNFDADVAPAGDALSFTVGTDGTLGYDAGDASDCKVRMRRIGPLLLVEDNGNCGGLNVSFTGTYRRK